MTDVRVKLYKLETVQVATVQSNCGLYNIYGDDYYVGDVIGEPDYGQETVLKEIMSAEMVFQGKETTLESAVQNKCADYIGIFFGTRGYVVPREIAKQYLETGDKELLEKNETNLTVVSRF